MEDTGFLFLFSERVSMECGARQVDLGVSGGVGKQELVLCTLMGLGPGVWGQDFGREGKH